MGPADVPSVQKLRTSPAVVLEAPLRFDPSSAARLAAWVAMSCSALTLLAWQTQVSILSRAFPGSTEGSPFGAICLGLAGAALNLAAQCKLACSRMAQIFAGGVTLAGIVSLLA